MNKQVVKKYQGDLALVSQPFTAQELKSLKQMKASGTLRRFSAIVRHQQIGMKANCMVVWQVPKRQASRLGRLLAKEAAVSHCYVRPGFPGFPYNLYAMTHGQSRQAIKRFAQRTAAKHKIKDYLLLWSVKEIKKTSPVFA